MKRILTILPLLFALTSCGADGAGAIQETILGKLKDLPKMLEGIKDQASFDAAKPKLEALTETVGASMKTLKDLPAVEGAEEATKGFTTKLDGIKDKVMAALDNMKGKEFLPQLKTMLAKIFPAIGG